jgi:1,4-dihydroxy-2-naphthoate octaprenyltransferase
LAVHQQTKPHVGKAQAWLLATRPKTLPASIVPVVLGGAFAQSRGCWEGVVFIAILSASVGIQIATNLVNDLCDYLRGTDREDRLGPLRAAQSGLLSVKEMKLGIAAVVGVLIILGYFLVSRAGLPVLTIGVFSLALAFLYTAGPYPLAYSPFSEFFVLLFFGPVAVGGTYYILCGRVCAAALWAGLGCGFISSAILCVNNLRDRESDKKSGRRTLAVLYGESFARKEYLFFLLAAAAVSFSLPFFDRSFYLAPLSGLFLAASRRTILCVREQSGRVLNQALADTGKLLLLWGVLLGLSMALSR